MRKPAGTIVAIPCVVLTAFFVLACAWGETDRGEDRDSVKSMSETPSLVQATLSRNAPSGAEAEDVEREIEHGLATWSAEYETHGGDLEISVLEDGTLVALERESKPSALPQAVRAAAEHELGGKAKKADHVRIAVYELEDTLDDGTVRERFVDPYGQVLLERRVAAGPDSDTPETVDDLPAVVRSTVERETGGAELTRVQKENEWGNVVHAASWQAADGPREVKVLEDGQVLYTELPTGPLPSRVATLLDMKGSQEGEVSEESAEELEEETAEERGETEEEARLTADRESGGPERLLLSVWEVEWKDDGHEVEALVLPTGDILLTSSGTESSESESDPDDD